MQTITSQISPGTMLSDVVETKLGSYQHQRIINLKQRKTGEWQTLKGFVSISGAFPDKVKSFIEVTSDETGERFLLLNIGDGLYRLDYDPINGYADTSSISDNLLPSGISLLKDRMRFNKNGNQIRITGLSKPLIYEYIKRKLFEYSWDGVSDKSMQIDSWVIEPSNVDDDDSNLNITFSISNVFCSAEQNTDPYYLQNAISFLFDNGQFSEPVNISSYNISKNSSFSLTVEIYDTSGLLSNQRILGFAILSSQQAVAAKMSEIPWQIVDIIYFNQEKIITYAPDDLIIDSADTSGHTLAIVKENGPEGAPVPKNHNARSWNKGDFVTLNIPDSATGEYLQIQDTIADVIEGNLSIRLKFLGTDFSTLSNCSKTADIGDGSKTYDCINGALAKIQKRFDYQGANNRYEMKLAYAYADALTDFYDYSGRSTIGNHAPNYDYHFVIGGRAFINSLEPGESDVVRYSPPGQYDVFPPDFVITTETGDTDKIKLAAKIGDRFIILKRKSGTFGSFVGNRFTQHTDFIKKGLYAENGWILIDRTLFFMDADDVYSFDGINANSIFTRKQLRNLYAKSVDENSFMAYNKLDKEIWFFLSDRILIWDIAKDEFYERETEAISDWAILDSENKLLLNNSITKRIITFNHSETIFEESLRYYVLTRLIDNQRQQNFKKLDRISLYLSSNVNITINVEDENIYNKDVLFNDNMDSIYEYHRYPNLLYRTLKTQINSQKSNQLNAVIRQMYLQAVIWK